MIASQEYPFTISTFRDEFTDRTYAAVKLPDGETVDLDEGELRGLIDQAKVALRQMEYDRVSHLVLIGMTRDHLKVKGSDKTLCGMDKMPGGQPYFGGESAAMCKLCGRAYTKQTEVSQ